MYSESIGVYCITVTINLNIASFLQLRTKVDEPLLLARKKSIDFLPKFQVIVIKLRKLQQKYKIEQKDFTPQFFRRTLKYLIISMYTNEVQQPLQNTSKYCLIFTTYTHALTGEE